MADIDLDKFENRQIAKVSRLQKKADAYKATALKLAVKSDKDIVKARATIKEINAYKNEVNDLRTDLTKPLLNVQKQLIAQEKEVQKPLDKAKEDLGKKILDYEDELEKARQTEEARIDTLIDRFSEIVYGVPAKNADDVDAKGKEVKEYYGSLDKKDQGHAKVKLALTTTIERLTSLKDSFTQREVSEKEELERQKSLAKAELEADKQEVKSGRMVAARPKTGAVTLTKFEITDPDVVPREFCTPNESLIREAIKAGRDNIPGVRIYTERKVR